MPHFHISDGMHCVSYSSGLHILDVGVRFAAGPLSPTISVVRTFAATREDPIEEAVLSAVLAGISRSKLERNIAHVRVRIGASRESLPVVEYVASLLGEAVYRGQEFQDA